MLLLTSSRLLAQHASKMEVTLDARNNTLQVIQELTYFNQTNDTIDTLVLNDWNHAYSDKNSLMGKRFSDEFVRSFHFANEKERGHTKINGISDAQNVPLAWRRLDNQVDLVTIPLQQKILPFEKRTFHFGCQTCH